MTDVMKRNIYEEIKRENILKELIKIFGKKYVSDKAHDLISYSYDMTESKPKMPDFVVIPNEVNEIVELVKFCNLYKIPIVPYVSGNNVGGLTIPEEGGIVCDLGKRMKRILKIHKSMMYAIIEPGVTFGQLKKLLDDKYPNLKYGMPMAPPYASVLANGLLTGLSNLSTKVGSMADMINGLEAVLYNGDVVRTGSCFLSKEYKEDNWFCRYPIPDLTGLFLGFQGMTGIVTKASIQLWPNYKFKTALLAIIYDPENCAAILREFGRSECCEEVSTITLELAKMGFDIKKPIKYEKEPDYVVMIGLSAPTKELLIAKVNYLKHIFEQERQKAKDKRMFLTNLDTFVNIIGEEFSVYFNLPNILTPLYEYDGLTWVGSYVNPEKLGTMMKKSYELYKKHDVGPIIYAKSMKASHYAVFRPIARFHKGTELQKIKDLQKEMLEMMLEYDCVPYKAPRWMTEEIKKKCDPNWIKLLQRIKETMDPKNIFNPGKWGL
ncbi:MAG: FAD-binding oxidoreductase [Promethearchaeota archaeon]